MRKIIVIAHDMRSTFNVGSLLRTAEGLGVEKVYLTGYTPYPVKDHDNRLPHIAMKLDQAIKKTALGAESMQPWEQLEDIIGLINTLKNDGYTIYALEQAKDSVLLPQAEPPEKSVLLLGTEVTGVPDELLHVCDKTIEIPMYGKKESFNVIQAAAMALYHFTFN